MSVNRAKIGDGTLYTNILDLNEGLIHLYFYHDFSKKKTFNLKEELTKGNHAYNFTNLFPDNKKYETFLSYQTPQNNNFIFIFLIASGVLFFFSAVFYLLSFFRSADTNYKYLKLGIVGLDISLCVYAYILIKNQGIFYFSAPYYDGFSPMVSLSSYLPFVLLLSMIPMFIYMLKIFRQKEWTIFAKYLLLINHLTYTLLLALFFYWQLFNVWN
jgi:hypothetical protein